MSDQIASVYAVQYGTNVATLLQQRGSKLRRHVRTEMFKGKQSEVVTQYGPTNARAVTTRYAPIEHVNTPNNRRWVYPGDYDWADIIDNFDKLRLLADPMSAYTINGQYAMGRKQDDVIIDAFFGDAKTGEAGGTTTSFPAAQQVAVNFAAGAAAGLTVDKLREGKRILMENEVDLDAESPKCAVTSEQHDDLLGQVQVVSSDFNGGDRPVLKDGKVERFLGIDFMHSERLDNDATPYRRVPLWVPSGMVFGVWGDLKSSIDQRKDLTSQPWQVYLMQTIGATRTEEGKIVEIKCAE